VNFSVLGLTSAFADRHSGLPRGAAPRYAPGYSLTLALSASQPASLSDYPMSTHDNAVL